MLDFILPVGGRGCAAGVAGGGKQCRQAVMIVLAVSEGEKPCLSKVTQR